MHLELSTMYISDKILRELKQFFRSLIEFRYKIVYVFKSLYSWIKLVSDLSSYIEASINIVMYNIFNLSSFKLASVLHISSKLISLTMPYISL